MVGFPGESEVDFNELLEFVRTQKFDRMGAFAYSEEEDTYAAKNLEDNVPQDIKNERLEKLMAVQEDMSDEINGRMIGKRVKLLVDENENGRLTCRSQWDSPDVDLTFIIENGDAKPGDFIEAEVVEALPFDFLARQIKRY